MSEHKTKRLNSKERKLFHQALQSYGYMKTLPFEILVNENKGKYYLIGSDVLDYPLESHRIETLGLYFGTMMPEGIIRLTVDGSQIIGPDCENQIFDITDEQYHEWIRGHDLELEQTKEHLALSGWLIIRHTHKTGHKDYAGCGKIVHKDDKLFLHNYVPKTRYVRSVD